MATRFDCVAFIGHPSFRKAQLHFPLIYSSSLTLVPSTIDPDKMSG